ncbi:MAG: 50S ribosomal protein L17 [Candidatus Eremiobacteraeota bacterium]|nr:50S ribosomal protein L17 [Candidatus Eremiobacteraeota bacterium]
MRHAKAAKRLGRNDDHRRSMLRNLTTSFFTHGTIETTVVRAKEVSRVASRIITRAKKGDLHSRRLIASYLTSEDVAKRVFDVIAPSLAGRPGGYTRMVRTRLRKGDAAEMAQLELMR